MMEPTATGGPTWQPAGRNQLARNERTPGSIAVGVKFGSVIGSLFDAHHDLTSAGRQSLSIAATLIEMQPQGGPYKNRHLSKDVLRLSGYPRIGDPRMPDAGCLHPPGAENTVQFWYPTKNAIGPAIRDAAKYSPIHAADGSVLTRWLFVIVQIKVDGRFQLRCYPDLSQRRRGR